MLCCFYVKMMLLKIEVFICWILSEKWEYNLAEKIDASILISILIWTSGYFYYFFNQLCTLAEIIPEPDPISHIIESLLKC